MTSRLDLAAEISGFVRLPPFPNQPEISRTMFIELLAKLTELHRAECEPYRKIIEILFPTARTSQRLSELPFIPVRLFKTLTLRSVSASEVIKTMTSSGTSGMATSKVYLDRDTASLQSKALAQTMSSILGNTRVPMLIIDSPSTVSDRASFSARGAGIRGFSMFGRPIAYAFDEEMNLNLDVLRRFSAQYSNEKVLLFGFTSVIWEFLIEALRRTDDKIDLSGGILVHGGGWKKLSALEVSVSKFSECVKEALGVDRVVNYYGMVEQTGSVFLECECGFLHSSAYGDIITRDGTTYELLPHGLEGIIQSISVLPLSYPGHSILTEDRGVILGIDDCKCGRSGTYFQVLGRLKDAELRGCSDVSAR